MADYQGPYSGAQVDAALKAATELQPKVTEIDGKLTELTGEVDSLNEHLDFASLQVAIEEGKTGYIAYNGIVSTSANWRISKPIPLRKGELLRAYFYAYTNMSAISLTDAEGSTYTLAVLGKTATPTVMEYTYQAENDCYVALSYGIQNIPSVAYLSTSEYINNIKNDIRKLEDYSEAMKKMLSQPCALNRGGYYITGNANVGGTASMTFTSNIDYSWAIINAKEGDIFFVSGTGGGSPRLWAFIDSDNKILASAAMNAVGVDEKIVAPADCRLVVNVRNYGYTAYRLMRYVDTTGEVAGIEQFTNLPVLTERPLYKIGYFLGYAGIIHHWGFVGDSLMSGFMENANVSNYDYSWGQRMCRILGLEGYNFSIGGQTAKGWIEEATSDNEMRVARSWGGAKTKLKQGYVVGFGVNDRSAGYAVGSVATDIGNYDSATDTDTNADTYAGYYAGVIQRLQSVNPTAKIFLATMPNNPGWANVEDYNKVVRDLAATFDNTYLIDLYTYAESFYIGDWWKQYFDSGHFNVIGYEYMASVMMQYIDWIIRNNIDDFAGVNLIPFVE